MLKPILIALSFSVGVFALKAEPTPHPNLPNRLVDSRDGFTIEYSPGDEAYVEAVFQAIESLRPLLKAKQTERQAATFQPLSAVDMRARRDEILAAVAASIGLAEPTDLQGDAYDTFLNYYELIGASMEGIRSISETLRPDGITIWRGETLDQRIQAGESIPNFSQHATTGKAYFQMRFDRDPAALERANAIKQAIKNPKLAHRFYREDGDGKSSYTASIDLGIRGNDPDAGDAPLLDSVARLPDAIEAAQDPITFLYPFIYDAESGRLPRDSAEAFILTLREYLNTPNSISQFRDSQFVAVILHETAEVGLVNHYINSKGRRWLCDGTANYVSWKVARDFAGEGFARSVYDLDQQLVSYAHLQDRVRLSRWQAAERDAEVNMDPELTKAHYAFATRAVFNFSEQEGEDALADLWRAIGQTPREKTTMKTASAAYRKLTGKKLSKLIRQAERASVESP